MSVRLAVFSRYPIPGQTKTRLIPALGPEGAARLQRQMTLRTLARTCPALSGEATVEVRFEGGDSAAMRDLFGNAPCYRPQGEGDLGARMFRAFRDAEAEGVKRTVLVGSDCPMLDARHIREAFERLATADVVLGPAEDGGYYLIGLRRAAGELFDGIAWEGTEVLKATLAAAGRAGLQVGLLETLSDVDLPGDLVHWHRARLSELQGPADRLSVVIPTLDEEDELAAALQPLLDSNDVEVLVVDGGSADRTTSIAREMGAEVLTGVCGRARQMNAGAAVAEGQSLLFLHADTVLPAGFQDQVRRTLEQAGVVAGAFPLAIRHASGSLRLIQRVANLRSRYLHLPYGDQALFARAATFHEIGGFPDLPIMEDFALARALGRHGRIVLADRPAVTSDRRWRRLGVWRTTLINQAVVLGYCLGASPQALADFYRRRR